MSLELKNKENQPITMGHHAAFANLKARAKLLEDIRAFFKARDVLEVETPLMCRAAATDPFLRAMTVFYSDFEHSLPENFYLQTSPEFAMKRLLADGVGSIYQICKAFRNGEVGRFHNPEFTMLEWYRLDFDHHDLMDEVDIFLSLTLEAPKAERLTYEAIFVQRLGLNPHQASIQQLKECAHARGVSTNEKETASLTADDWLDILMTHCIEPELGFERPAMIYDFPASKAALSKVRIGNPNVAERFEVYVQGIELANGYHELRDPNIQYQRFLEDCEVRKKLGFSAMPIDAHLIEALKKGLPASAGVALGIDRLLMLKLKSPHIREVVAFTIDQV